MTLVLVPVLYSLTSRFTRPRTTRDLDASLDAAQDRRFKPLGMRGLLPAPEFTVHLTIEPEPGTRGDPKVLQILTDRGYRVRPLDGSARMLIEVTSVAARSSEEAATKALDTLSKLVPDKGYRLLAAESASQELVTVPV